MYRLKGIPPIITLTAGGIACWVSAYKGYSTLDALLCILITIAVFYVIGLIVKEILSNVVEKMEEREAERLAAERIAEEEEARLELERQEMERLEQMGLEEE